MGEKFLGCDLDTIRISIIRSKKFILGKEILPLDHDLLREVYDQVFGEEVSGSPEKLKKKLFLIEEYGKLPYSEVFLENSLGGILLQQKDNDVIVTTVTADGSVDPFRYTVCSFKNNYYRMVVPERYRNFVENAQNNKLENIMQSVCKTWSAAILNALTYINTKNVSIETYKMTKSEAKRNKLPNVMLKQYDYHVVNIFHKKVVYEKLADVEAFSDSETTSHIRAHMVRGHFKQRNSGLYWWNPFLRCKKNQGFVDKDYIVH